MPRCMTAIIPKHANPPQCSPATTGRELPETDRHEREAHQQHHPAMPPVIRGAVGTLRVSVLVVIVHCPICRYGRGVRVGRPFRGCLLLVVHAHCLLLARYRL